MWNKVHLPKKLHTWVFNQLNCFHWLHTNFTPHTAKGQGINRLALIYILSCYKSRHSCGCRVPISKNYKFTISWAMPTGIKPLRQCLLQLLVYVNMNIYVNFMFSIFYLDKLQILLIITMLLFFFYIYGKMFLICPPLFGELSCFVNKM